MRRDGAGCVVPDHKQVKRGTMLGILAQAGVSAEEFKRAVDC